MYPGAGYWQTSHDEGVAMRVKRSLSICFSILVLILAVASLQQSRVSAVHWTPAMNAGEWNNTIALTILGGRLYTIEKSGLLYRTDLTNGKWVQLGKADFANTQFLFLVRAVPSTQLTAVTFTASTRATAAG